MGGVWSYSTTFTKYNILGYFNNKVTLSFIKMALFPDLLFCPKIIERVEDINISQTIFIWYTVLYRICIVSRGLLVFCPREAFLWQRPKRARRSIDDVKNSRCFLSSRECTLGKSRRTVDGGPLSVSRAQTFHVSKEAASFSGLDKGSLEPWKLVCWAKASPWPVIFIGMCHHKIYICFGPKDVYMISRVYIFADCNI